jgi:hypothetical protein
MSQENRSDRRKPIFIERLSMTLVVVSAIGAILVLIDPVIQFQLQSGTVMKFGGEGFSDQLKGAVISLILVSGFAAVISYWLGASNQGVKAQDSVNNIAQAATPSPNNGTRNAAPAATPITTEVVNVEAQQATLTQAKGPKDDTQT